MTLPRINGQIGTAVMGGGCKRSGQSRRDANVRRQIERAYGRSDCRDGKNAVRCHLVHATTLFTRGFGRITGTGYYDWGIILSECPGLKLASLFIRTDDDACSGDFAINKFETRWIGALAKETLAVADSDRKNQDVHLIDQSMLQKRLNEIAAPMNL